MKKSVFITRQLLPDAEIYLLQKGFKVEVNQLARPMDYRELLEKAQEHSALITTLADKIDSHFLEVNRHLEVIVNYAVGYNNIDLLSAKSLSIAIGNTPDVLTEATAEIAFGLMIATARHFLAANKQAAAGLWKDWDPTGFLGHGLQGKTLGIIGFGRIGQRLGEMCKLAFKMEIIYTTRGQSDIENNLEAKRVEIEDLLANSDFISIHAPLNKSTKHLIGEKEFKLMKKSAILINTARGEILNQEALISALSSRSIFAAGLDVTDPEPLNPNNELFKLSNAFVLPHIGSATFEARKNMAIMAAQKIECGLTNKASGKWLNEI